MSGPGYPQEASSSGKLPLVRLAKGQEVSLGCGTLILITILVAIVTGSTNRDVTRVEQQVQQMNQRLERIEQKLDDMAKKRGGPRQ
jgi:hypothetical protein